MYVFLVPDIHHVTEESIALSLVDPLLLYPLCLLFYFLFTCIVSFQGFL